MTARFNIATITDTYNQRWSLLKMTAIQGVVLQSRVRIRRLPSPQLSANLLVGRHRGWHMVAGWPLWGATEEKTTKKEPLVHQKHTKKKKKIIQGVFLFKMNLIKMEAIQCGCHFFTREPGRLDRLASILKICTMWLVQSCRWNWSSAHWVQ